MIQVRMGMDDADHLQAQGVEPGQDQLMIAARIDDDGFFRQRIANDRAVALQGPTGKVSRISAGFAESMGCSRNRLDKQ